MTTREHLYKNVLPFFNIQEYWDKGFKGQGVTIASMEDTSDGHGSMVADTLLTYAPECRVISFTDEKGYSAMGDDNKEKIRFPEFVNWCIEHNVDIVTSSLDWKCDKDVEKQAIKKLYDAGIIFCNCAGNDGDEIKKSNQSKTWGFDKEVLTISGLSIDVNGKVRWSGFNYGDAVDLVTMGTGTPTIARDGGACYGWGGTSVATPMSAGMLAVYKSFDKSLNSKNVFDKIVNKMETTIEYNGFKHKILVLPKIETIGVENTMEKDKDKFENETWAKEGLEWAEKVGLSDCTRLDENITRREVIVMLYRLFKLYE